MEKLRSAACISAAFTLIYACSSSSHDGGGGASAGIGGVAAGSGGVGGAHGGAAGQGEPLGGSNAGGSTSAAGAAGAEAEAGAAGSAEPVGAREAFAWQVSFGQSYAAHVAVDSQGAALVSGTMFDSAHVTLGKTELVSAGGADVVLSRILPAGSVDWARRYGGTSDDYPVSFVLDAQDRIFLSGLYNGTGNLGSGDFPAFMGTSGRLDASIASFAANGDPRWSYAITSTQEDFAGPGLALDASGNLFVPGAFLGTTSIAGSSYTSAGSWDAFFARYDAPDGSPKGSLTFGSTGEDRAEIALLTASDLILIGKFSGTVSFPTTPATELTSAGGTDVFIARAPLSGGLTSVLRFGGTGDEDVTSAHLDSQQRVVLVGDFSSPTLSILSGKTLQNAGGMDFFAARLSPKLELDWAVSFGSTADDAARDLTILPDDTLALTGEFRNELTLGDQQWNATPNPEADAGTSTDIDYFVVTLDQAGEPLWSYAAGGPGQERGLGIAADASGALYVTASFTSAIDFGGDTALSAAAGQFASALVRYAPHAH